MADDVRPPLTAEEVCVLLGIPGPHADRLLRDAIRRGAAPKPLPKIGRDPKWSRVVVARWLEQNGRIPRAPVSFKKSA